MFLLPNIKSKDIMVFNSHIPTKRSYHIVVDNWCFTNSLNNKYFYKYVMEGFPEKLKSSVDSSMYSSMQQFRIYKSHKWQSNNIKQFDENSDWMPTNNCKNTKQLKFNILFRSLVTNCGYCKILPSFAPEKVYRPFEDLLLESPQIIQAINLCAKSFECEDYLDNSFPFDISDIRGGLILLKRRFPSYCKTCLKTHDGQDSYMIINRSGVYLDCRRHPEEKKLYLGFIDISNKEEEVKEDDEDDDKSEWSTIDGSEYGSMADSDSEEDEEEEDDDEDEEDEEKNYNEEEKYDYNTTNKTSNGTYISNTNTDKISNTNTSTNKTSNPTYISNSNKTSNTNTSTNKTSNSNKTSSTNKTSNPTYIANTNTGTYKTDTNNPIHISSIEIKATSTSTPKKKRNRSRISKIEEIETLEEKIEGFKGKTNKVSKILDENIISKEIKKVTSIQNIDDMIKILNNLKPTTTAKTPILSKDAKRKENGDAIKENGIKFNTEIIQETKSMFSLKNKHKINLSGSKNNENKLKFKITSSLPDKNINTFKNNNETFNKTLSYGIYNINKKKW